MRRTALLLLVALSATPPVLAGESAAKDGGNSFVSDVKKMGRQVGRTAKKVGKDIGQGTVRAARTVKREFREDFIDGKDDDGRPRRRNVDREGRK